ncbi:MAG: DUF4012 domain-containing protein [Patescibacteria group bacterium]
MAKKKKPKNNKVAQKKFYKKKWVIIVSSVVLLILIVAGLSYAPGKNAYQYAMLGKEKIVSAQAHLEEQKFEETAEAISEGLDNFQAAKDSLDNIKIFKYFPIVGRQLRAVDDLLVGGISLGNAAKKVADLALDIYQIAGGSQDVNFAEITVEQKEDILKKLSESTPTLQQAKGEIDLAAQKIDNIPSFAVLAPIRNAVDLIEEKLPPIQDAINNALPIVSVLPEVFGHPEPKTYLFLLQNNHELRPSGGFIGTYGIITLKSAEIDTFWTDNIYNIDKLSQDTLFVDPPWQLAKYLSSSQWFLRDSNWSPDFPTTAEQTIWFYQQEGGAEQLDGVIAVTPTFIESLIALVGDITVHGITFNKENFVETLQYQVEQGFYRQGIPESERKEVIGDMAKVLMDRVLALPQSKYSDLWSTFSKDTAEKHILLYLKNQNAQNMVLEQKWGGKLQEGNGDFLMAVDCNMASLKTDPDVKRTINYQITKQDGEYIAQADIKYEHTGEFDWKTTRYRTYNRIYVPKGSQLISSSGAMDNDRSTAPGEVETIEEFNRTVFGAFIAIEPGETGTLSYQYKLPKEVTDLIEGDKYILTVQKQSGTISHQLNLSFDFDRNIDSWHPLDKGQEQDNNIVTFSTDLLVDRNFAINF